MYETLYYGYLTLCKPDGVVILDFARLRLGYTFSAMLLQPVVIAVFVGLLWQYADRDDHQLAGIRSFYLGVNA